MKKYKRIILGLSVLYLILAGALFAGMLFCENTADSEYRVIIHRMTREFSQTLEIGGQQDGEISELLKSEKIQEMSLDRYGKSDCIYGMYFLQADITDVSEIQKFYETKNKYEMYVEPVILNGRIAGYLRFDYSKKMNYNKLVVISELSLLLIYILSSSILLYTNRMIIKPFNKLNRMPYDLAKGNFNSEVKESKSKYFGKFVWGIGMLKDTLDSQKKREYKLVKDKKMLILSISHDIKTPLNAINLYSKAIYDGIYKTQQEQKEAVLKIQEKTEEINGFVKEIIKSSTEDIMDIEVTNSEFYLQELVDKVKIGFVEKCSIRKIAFEISSYENVLLKGDIDRLYEVIGNLIENAYKYGDGMKIVISFSQEEYCQLIHVYNSGEPVKKEETLHLFESFYRGSNVSDKSGNGLGLYICSEIMKKMDGDIYVNSLSDGMEFVLVCQLSS